MKPRFFATLTHYGEQVLANAIANNQPLNITKMAVGDGNGQEVIPDQTQTTLVNEVYRSTLNDISRNPQNDQQVIFELLIPSEIGGFWSREMGIFDESEKLVAVANCPASFKPILASGSGKVQVLRMILQVSSSDAVTLSVDEGVILVTREELNKVKTTINQHITDFRNPDGFKLMGQVESVEQLRTIRPTEHGQRILVKSYYAGGTTGGGEFVADLQDLVTPDDGGTCFVVQQNGGRWKRVIKATLNVVDFGIKSDDTRDVTSLVQIALNSAASLGKVLEFGFEKTYFISSINIPEHSCLKMNESVFRKNNNDGIAVVGVKSHVVIDKLHVSTSGASNDNGVRIKGSHVNIHKLVCESDNVDSQYGVLLQSDNGQLLSHIKIGDITVKNFKSGVLVYGIKHSEMNNISVEGYVTGVYLRDVSNCHFTNADIHTTSPSATGGAGNNGLLIESTTQSGSSHDLYFSGWRVKDAGEHSYRLGGQLSMHNVWFNHCSSVNSGAVNGNISTGGCGFKVLGATSVAGQSHSNIFFNQCHVQDVNTNARGQGNFCGFLISSAKNVHITNSSVVNKNGDYSCWHGISLESVEDVFLTNNNVDNCRQHAIRVVSAIYTQYPGWSGKVKNVKVEGGSYSNHSAAGSAVIYFVRPSGETGVISQFMTSGVLIRGGIAAIRAESYFNLDDCYFDFTYTEPANVDGSPPILGAPALYNVRSKWFGSYGAAAKNGSTFTDLESGVVRRRFENSWFIDNPTIAQGVNLTATVGTNVSEATHIRSRYTRQGNIINVSGVLSVKPTSSGRLDLLLEAPVASNSSSWADCSGTWDSSDGAMHGVVTLDSDSKKLKLTGVSTISDVRHCSYIASYMVA